MILSSVAPCEYRRCHSQSGPPGVRCLVTKVISILDRLRDTLDPRLRLTARIGWTFTLLTVLLSVVAGLYIGEISQRTIEREVGAFYASRAQHVADSIDFRIASSTNTIRLAVSALQAAGWGIDPAQDRKLVSAIKPDLSDAAWIGVTDAAGIIVAGENHRLEGDSLAGQSWFKAAAQGQYAAGPARFPELEAALAALASGQDRVFYFISSPILDGNRSVIGFAVAALAMDRIDTLPWRAAESPAGTRPVDIFLLDEGGRIISQLFDNGDPTDNALSPVFVSAILSALPERDYGALTTGEFLVGFARSKGYGDFRGTGWTVVVREAKSSAYLPANQAAIAIGLACLILGLALSFSAVFGTRFILRGLARVAASADDLRTGRAQEFVAISGRDEVADISRSLAALFNQLQRSKDALSSLNRDLDKKVVERTREIQRLSEETQNAAITRERLRISRDLHDTLAHSMLAVLTQIRMMQKLAKTRPELVEEELGYAAQAAQEGLDLARNAVTELRYFAVRDDGLERAVKLLVKRLQERTEIDATVDVDPAAAALTGPKAEIVYRIVEEALHNIEAHAQAAHVRITVALDRADPSNHLLKVIVEDDGKGFDSTAGKPGHYGLRGMREQAEILGGRLEITSAEGKGTRIALVTSL
jgi:signal transduction histidine kinase